MNSAPDPNPENDRSSTALQGTPKMTPVGLTVLLVLMCCIPIITIFLLWKNMPPVYEGALEAAVSATNLPPDSFYEVYFSERSAVAPGQLLVRNLSEQDWTHLNIQINHNYQIYDIAPILAGETREFELDRFLNRTGARFQLRYNPLQYVRIYARRPTKDRATFEWDFAENGIPALD